MLVSIREEILKFNELKNFNSNFLKQLENRGREELNNLGWKCEYVKIINKEYFREPVSPKMEWRQLIVLTAARLGNTRLIDNIEIA